jgi:hypothetical protein
MGARSLDVKRQVLANEKNLPHVLENTKLHAWKEKNLIVDFNASGAARASSEVKLVGRHMMAKICVDSFNNLNFLEPLIPEV